MLAVYKNSWRLLAVCVLAGILYFVVSLSVQYWFKSQYVVRDTKAKTKILLIWYRGIGEQETIERLKITSKRLDIELKPVSTKPPYYIRWFVKDPVAIARKTLQPDFILSIQDWVEYYPDIKNYMTLTLGTERYIKPAPNGGFMFINPEHEKFDALLPSFTHIDQLKLAYERNGKKYHGFPWYPTSYVTDYPVAIPQKLFYSGGFLWDETRGSQKYKELFIKLDATGYFAVCGPKKKWRHTPSSAIGFVPVDGISLLAEHHKAGISLLLHTQLHLNGGAPTGRIFEAVSAKTVIISDKNPFIEKNFGDNVLYVDTTQDADGMFKQIDDHVQWIHAHPQQAQQMAENCFDIFLHKFTMEEQLTHLVELHQSLLK